MEHGIWKTDLGAPLNFTTVMRLQGPVSEAALRAALPVLRARHTHLRTRIVAEGAGAVFRTDDVPPLPLRVVPGREARWLEELEREINQPFPEKGPLGRFTLLEGEPGTAWLLATLHHSVADGMSGVFLLRDLVQCLAQLAAGEAPRLPPLEDPGPVDALLPDRARGATAWGHHLRFVLRELGVTLRHGRPLRLRRDRDVFAHERRARVIAHELDEKTAEALLARARMEKTTVHGALSAAILLGVMADAGVPRASVTFGSPVNVRARLRQPVGEQLGFYVSMMAFRRGLRADVPFWDLARAVRQSLEADLARGDGLPMLHLLPLMMRMLGGEKLTPRGLVEQWEKNVPATAGLTNLGRLPIDPAYGPLSIEACFFAASPSALGDFVSTASSLRGKLFWNFVWPDPVLTEAHAQALIGDITARLRAAIAA
jgi:hypothetical protein